MAWGCFGGTIYCWTSCWYIVLVFAFALDFQVPSTAQCLVCIDFRLFWLVGLVLVIFEIFECDGAVR